MERASLTDVRRLLSHDGQALLDAADALAAALEGLGVRRPDEVLCLSPGLCGKRTHHSFCVSARSALEAYRKARGAT